MERKEGDQASLLAPPSDLLRQFILLRKAVATRTIEAIRQAYEQVKTATYPFQFQHTDAIPYLAVHPQSTLAIQEQAVSMPFMLWNKRSWVGHHQKQFSLESTRPTGCATRGNL
jgi:hypothetical protein